MVLNRGVLLKGLALIAEPRYLARSFPVYIDNGIEGKDELESKGIRAYEGCQGI